MVLCSIVIVLAMGVLGRCGAMLSGGCAVGLCVWSGVHVDFYGLVSFILVQRGAPNYFFFFSL